MKKRAPARVRLFGRSYARLVARIGANVRRLRSERAWTQEECAFRCKDLGPSLLRRIEAGRTNITAATLARLCDGLKVDASELFAPVDAPKKRTSTAKEAAAPARKGPAGTGVGEARRPKLPSRALMACAILATR